MLLWENSEDVSSLDFIEIRKNIELLGSRFLARKAKRKADKEGFKWVKDFKVWEYPFVYLWLENLRTEMNKHNIKVMDFGCGFTPFTEYLNIKGFKAVGVDKDFLEYDFKANEGTLKQEYPNSDFHIGDMSSLPDNYFDAVISCSVLEHIMPHTDRVKVMKTLEQKLKPTGKSLHIIDYYFSEKPGRDGDRRIDVFDLMNRFEWTIEDGRFCPEHELFDFDYVKKNVNFLREWNQEARIAIGG